MRKLKALPDSLNGELVKVTSMVRYEAWKFFLEVHNRQNVIVRHATA